jgi:hypothetical protein
LTIAVDLHNSGNTSLSGRPGLAAIF